MSWTSLIRAANVHAAAERIDGYVRETPLLPARSVADHAGVEVLFKHEQLQRTGSFKLRGALNAVLAANVTDRPARLVTASAGNHALGVAHAAQLVDARADIFLPADAPPIKRAGVLRSGATVHECDGGYDHAHAVAAAYARAEHYRYVHAFSDPEVIAGQGTVGLEILRACPQVATLLVPVGGGGLAGGIGVIARELAPDVRIIGVQSTATAAMHDSLRAGRVIDPEVRATLCDGLSGAIDEPSLRLTQAVVNEIRLVSEEAVREAIRLLYHEEGIVAEGSAAVVAAALIHRAVPHLRGPVVAVISGGNIEPTLLDEIVRSTGDSIPGRSSMKHGAF